MVSSVDLVLLDNLTVSYYERLFEISKSSDSKVVSETLGSSHPEDRRARRSSLFEAAAVFQVLVSPLPDRGFLLLLSSVQMAAPAGTTPAFL